MKSNQRNLNSLLRKVILPFVVILLISSACSEKETQSQTSSRVILNTAYKNEIIEGQKAISIYLMSTRTPGLSVSVSIDGETIWSEGAGLANYELESPATPETKYLLGRPSQMFTIFLIAKLHEEGKLDVNKSFYDYVPNFPKKKWDFTSYQLGTYSAGFRENKYSEVLNENEFEDYKDYIEYYKNDTLRYEPNTSYLQSDYATCLLGLLAEEISEKSFSDLIEEKITTPLGLGETSLDNSYYIIKNRSGKYYKDKFSFLVNAPAVDYSQYAPAYGFISTADDLNKAGQSVLNTDFFNQETLDLFFSKNIITDKQAGDFETNRGFGWWVAEDANNRIGYAQHGSTIGGNSMLIVFPEQKLVVSICANIDDQYASLPAEAIANIFLNKIDTKESE